MVYENNRVININGRSFISQYQKQAISLDVVVLHLITVHQIF